MKNKRIMNAYDSINPSPADKQRMLDAILAEAKLKEAPNKTGKTREKVVYTQKQSTKTRRTSFWGTLAAAIALVMVAGFGAAFLMNRQPSDPVLVEPATEVTTPAETAPEFPESVYTETLEKYRHALDGCWDRAMCVENGISMLTPIESEYEGLYYAISDLDGNGIEELVISEYPYREDTDTSFIDIYTVLDGHVIQLMSLGDLDMRYLCEDGYVKDLSSPDVEKYSHYVSFWCIVEDQFMQDSAVYQKSDGQWITEGYRKVGAAISQEEADQIIAANKPAKLDFAQIKSSSKGDYSITGYEAYDYIINKYVTALTENWTDEQCEQNDISPDIFSSTTISHNLGWCLMDIDKNGVEDLVISDGVSLFDLYVMMPHNGGPGHLIMANGGMSYTLCKDGTIEQRELFSKGCSWSYFTLSDWELSLESILIYRNEYEETTATERYYYGKDADNTQPISKDEAGNIIVNENRSAMELAITPFVTPEPFDPDERLYYQNLLELFQTALDEDWHPATCMENGLSLMVAHRGEYYDDLGYTMLDLDGNGIDELIITDGRNIYDLYTIIQDEETGPLHLISAMERLDYYLIQNNHLFYRGSGGAARQVYCHYVLEDRKLTLLEGYGFDADTDPENPWFFHDGEEYGDPCGSFNPQSIIDSYEIAQIPFTPFR